MSHPVVFLSIPGLHERHLPAMPRLAARMAAGEQVPLTASFPCVTWPVQANLLTGKLPEAHGVVANGFYWRDPQQVEMWTAWNEKILAPQVWDLLVQEDAARTTAAWFPMLSKGSGATCVCMPAPIHNPDGSEDLWCYTKPTELYGELRDRLGHFPLQHFWGPLANIRSTAWIVDSAVVAGGKFRPDFFYIYLPHLDYAAQKSGPASEPAETAVRDLDEQLGRLFEGLDAAYAQPPVWLAASEYVITPVNHVVYPNRVLRAAGLLQTTDRGDGEQLDFQASSAWALADHQMSHVFVRERDPATITRVVDLFSSCPGIAEVLAGDRRDRYHLGHERSGDVVLVSTPDSWQAYYWWLDARHAPSFARTVDIHRKPGYDPVELHFDPATRSIPLDADLVCGSHGAPVHDAEQRGTILSSQTGVLGPAPLRDIDVASVLLRQFR
jgi:hypothetical protein